MDVCERWRRYLAVSLAVYCLILSLSAGALEMKAGTAKCVITPEPGKERISVMGDPLKGVLKDIHARALTLFDGERRLAIVTYDLNCLDVATPILRQRCRDELGLPADYLILMATHNHAAPIQIVPDNFDYGRWLAERIFDLIKQAISKEQGPVQLMFGSDYGYFLKAVGNAPTDYEVQVLKVAGPAGPVAVLFNQPTHPIHETYEQINPAHPGYAMDEVEQMLPGAQAMYADASGGNQFTLRMMDGSADEVKKYGHQLAEVVLKVVKSPMQDVTGPLSSKLAVISLSLAKPLSRESAENLAKFAPKDIGYVPYPNDDRESNWIRALMKYYEQGFAFPTKSTDLVCTDDGFMIKELETPREFPCRYEETIVSKIGSLIFVAMQGEVCAPIGVRIKDAIRCERPIMVGAYMGEHNLYIPTRELVRLNYYQAQVLQIQYACPVGWAPTVEDEMVDGVIRMIRALP